MPARDSATTIRRAAALVGGVEPLAAHLGVQISDVLLWISASQSPAAAVVERANAIIAASETQRLSLRTPNAARRSEKEG